MPECLLCGRDPELAEHRINADGRPYVVKGHACHCIRDESVRVAIGICCGRSVGEKLLAEEDRFAEILMKSST
jgi:hypothetical protein